MLTANHHNKTSCNLVGSNFAVIFWGQQFSHRLFWTSLLNPPGPSLTLAGSSAGSPKLDAEVQTGSDRRKKTRRDNPIPCSYSTPKHHLVRWSQWKIWKFPIHFHHGFAFAGLFSLWTGGWDYSNGASKQLETPLKSSGSIVMCPQSMIQWRFTVDGRKHPENHQFGMVEPPTKYWDKLW